MRVNTVEKCLKPQRCGHCNKEIAKGARYRWAKGRYGPKMVRCDAYNCRFRQSDLTSGKKADPRSRHYDAAAQAHLRHGSSSWTTR